MSVFLVIISFIIYFVGSRYICEKKTYIWKILNMTIKKGNLKKTYIHKRFFLLDNTFAFIVKINNCLEFIRKFSRNAIFINDVSLNNTLCFSMKKSLISWKNKKSFDLWMKDLFFFKIWFVLWLDNRLIQ
jgi:hypothetical protein